MSSSALQPQLQPSQSKKGYRAMSLKAREFLQSQSDHMQYHVVDSNWMGQRVDDFVLQQYPQWSYGQVQKLVEQGHIYRYRTNGKKLYTRLTDRLESDELVIVPTSAFWQSQIAAPNGIEDPREEERTALHLTTKVKNMAHNMVVFKNEHVIVLNKPAGVPMMGGKGVTVNIADMLPALKFTRSETPHICHTLDRETSGCVVLARSAGMKRMLAKNFVRRVVPNSVFWGYCVGKPAANHGRIRMYFEEGKGGQIIARPTPTKTSRVAISEYVVNASALEFGSFVSFYPLTSRKHQLRIMAAHALRCPVMGDATFGGDNAFPDSLSVFWDMEKRDMPLHLHHRKIQLPFKKSNGEFICVTAEVPAHMRETMNKLGWPCDVDDPLIPG